MNRDFAAISLAVLCAAGCTTPGKRTAMGAGAGAAGGAAAGAAIGAATGNAGKGAWIGAVAGGALGTYIGNRMDKQARELEQIAETRRTEEGIITKLRNDLLFPTDSADVKQVAKNDLTQISEIIKKYPEDRITVVGYTDDRGSQSYNQSLSERRARSVKLTLVNNGVDPQVIETLGQGESNPVSDNTSADGRAKNRRVELQITPDPSKVKRG